MEEVNKNTELDNTDKNLHISDVMVSSSIMSIELTEEQKLKDKLPPQLWYKYFYKKPPEFNFIQLPKVNRRFLKLTITVEAIFQ